MTRIALPTVSALLLFCLVAAEPGRASDEGGSPAAALSLWAEIEGASQSELFRDFATRFPDNPLARLARARADDLDGVTAPPDPARFPADAATRSAAEAGAELVEEPSFETIRARLGYRAAKRANIRSGPSTETSVVGQLETGDLVQVESREGDWWRIRLDGGTEGYVYGPLVEDLGLEAADFSGVLSPKVATIATIEPAAAPDCVHRPTRPCLAAMIEAEFGAIEELWEQIHAISTLAGAYFRLGDVEAGWSSLLRAVRLARSAPEDEYNDENERRASLLAQICSTMSLHQQPRIALAVCVDALTFARVAKANKDYYSDAGKRYEATRGVASSLAAHPQLVRHARLVADQALAMAANLPEAGTDSAAEERADALGQMIGVYTQLGMVTKALRTAEQSYVEVNNIDVLDDSGWSVSFQRYSELYWNTRRIADLGFVDWAWELAWQMPDAPQGDYKGQALAYVIKTASRMDRGLAEELAGRIEGTADSIWDGDGLQFLIEAGYQALAERIIPRLELPESELYSVGSGYAAIGEVEKALAIAAQMQDEDYRKWVFQAVASGLVGTGQSDRVATVLRAASSAAETASVEEGIAQGYSTKVNELLARGDGASALATAVSAAQELGRLDAWMLAGISAHAVKTGDRDLALGAARAAAETTPIGKVFVYTDLLLLTK